MRFNAYRIFQTADFVCLLAKNLLSCFLEARYPMIIGEVSQIHLHSMSITFVL